MSLGALGDKARRRRNSAANRYVDGTTLITTLPIFCPVSTYR
jgi:hypothetical protein